MQLCKLARNKETDICCLNHSSIGFKIKHLAISNVPGKFTKYSGTFEYDPNNVAASKADATIEIASIDTEEIKRDDHLRSADFFDIKNFPQMTFKSKEVHPSGKDSFKVNGDLTIRGITKPVTLDVTYNGEVTDPWGNVKAGFSATTNINRKDFGLTWNKVLETGGLVVGEEVKIAIEVEGKKIA